MKPFYYCILLLIALTVSADARTWTAWSGEAQDDPKPSPFVIDDPNPTPSPFVITKKLGYNTPREILEQEAQKDNPEALLFLARCYSQGWNGCPKDEEKANEFYQRGSALADTGNPFAQCCRSTCYGNGIGVSKDEAEAVKWIRKAAEQGNAVGQGRLGNCYAQGMGVPQDDAEAVKLLRLAAEQGDADGQFFLGVCYSQGKGVSEDMEEAVMWFRKAAEQGFVPAQSMLGACYADGMGVPQDMAEAVKWCRLAAEQGDVPSQFMLGMFYAEGAGVPQDEAEAMKWFHLAAAQGFELAINVLKRMEPPTEETELDKIRKAAEQGDAVAQNNLGVCYEQGNGVAQDIDEAVKWYRKAAEQGLAEAQNNLGVCYLMGRGVPEDEAEGVKWLRLGAEQGYVLAQRNLGSCYANGYGVPQDKAEAVKWLRKAMEQGDEKAIELLQKIEKAPSEDSRFIALTGHTDDVRAAAFAPDGKTVVTAGADDTVRVWDAATGQELKSWNPGLPVGNVLYLAGGKRVVTLESSDTFCTLQVWDVDPNSASFGKELRKQERMGGAGLSLCISENLKKLACSTYDVDDTGGGQVWAKVWDVDTGRLQLLRSRGGITNWGHPGWFKGEQTDVSPDGTRAITIRSEVMGSCYIVLWDTATGRELRRLGASARPISGRQGATPGEAMGAVFSPDSSKVATHHGENVCIWDVNTGRELRRLAGYTGDFLPDGKRFAASSDDNLILYDVSTGRKLATLEGTQNVLIAKDGRKIATQNEAGVVRVWDTNASSTAMGKELYRLENFPVAFSEDGRKMVAINASGDAWAVVDADSGTTLLEVQGQFLGLAPDGKRVITANDTTARIWDVP